MLILRPKRWTEKPPGEVAIDWGHPLANGLVFHSLCHRPGYAVDLVTGQPITWKAGTTLTVGERYGPAGMRTDATTEGATITCPEHLKLQVMTILWRGLMLAGTPTGGSGVFNISANNSDVAPYIAYGFFRQSGTLFRLHWNNGSIQTIEVTAGAAGDFQTFAATIQSGAQALYKNGLSIGSGTAVGTTAYSATSQLSIGSYANTSRNPLVWTDAVWIYNRRLSPGELCDLHYAPWQALVPQSPKIRIFGVAGAPPTVFPHDYYARQRAS